MMKSISFTRSGIAVILVIYSFLAFTQSFSFFYPSSASPGNALTIAGTDLSTVASENVVYIGGVKAEVQYSTGTEVLYSRGV